MTRDSGTSWEEHPPRRPLKPVERLVWRTPDFDAAEHVALSIHDPHRASLPAEALAHRLQDARGGADQGRSFRQRARYGVLCGTPPLDPVPLDGVPHRVIQAMAVNLALDQIVLRALAHSVDGELFVA